MDRISFSMLDGKMLFTSKSTIPKSVDRMVFPS